jgi:predicted protein tyrosine phosphatase
MKVLFVCSRNRRRSPTAEILFEGFDGIEARSAGLAMDAEVVVSGEDVEWADTIFVMERKHGKGMKDRFPKEMKNKRLICLDIKDEYGFMEPELVELLERKVLRKI